MLDGPVFRIEIKSLEEMEPQKGTETRRTCLCRCSRPFIRRDRVPKGDGNRRFSILLTLVSSIRKDRSPEGDGDSSGHFRTALEPILLEEMKPPKGDNKAIIMEL